MVQNHDANSVASIDRDFVKLACSWMQDPAHKFLDFIWSAYKDMRASPPIVNTKDLERSITQLLEPRVRENMTGYEPFYIQHEPYERETMKEPPAQPPQYDLAFVFRADERIMWPMEAKVLETSKKVSTYILGIEKEFLTCRYAPFSNSGAMLGYLLTGNPSDVFEAIAQKLNCALEPMSEFPHNPNRLSRHKRNVPAGKQYPLDFDCYHMILEFPDLSRAN